MQGVGITYEGNISQSDAENKWALTNKGSYFVKIDSQSNAGTSSKSAGFRKSHNCEQFQFHVNKGIAYILEKADHVRIG